MSAVRMLSVTLLGFVIALPSVGAAQSGQSDQAGKTLYLHYCSSCHGEKGKGDGALAPILELKPTDLTQLAKAKGGELSYVELLRSIDGRQRVRGHGETGMPVWGEVFVPKEGAPVDVQLQGAGKLLLITYYVESLQEK